MQNSLPKRKEDYSKWYNDLIKKADLAEISPVRGCMIIKPYGYAIWENIQSSLDQMFKETGHRNVYFPLFIPKSYFTKEASHIEGFAKECAVVTHYRLKKNIHNGSIEVDPEAKLEEELIVRPTSETVIWDTYKKWVQSYRDLPLLLNQWSNVVRWEMRTRMFLRTTEILWQEGHTAHATKEEAIEETEKMLNVYREFIEDYMAIPVSIGKKTENEKFAGAEATYTLEVLTQDGRALQAGTSHFLGTNFAKAFDVKYINKKGVLEYVWGTSWGTTTRLIGALIMTHSDDRGLVLPPKIAPIQVIIIPIFDDENQRSKVFKIVEELAYNLKRSKNISVKIDARDYIRPGRKFSESELQGIPLRITIGPNDLENNTLEIFRRDILTKQVISIDEGMIKIPLLLKEIQSLLYQKALKFRNDNTRQVNDFEEFTKVIREKRGFVLAHWDGTTETEQKIKELTKATIRCIPETINEDKPGTCIYSGKSSRGRVLFAEAY